MDPNTDNLQIILRLLELAKNNIDWQEYPRAYKEETIWLGNILNEALTIYEAKFIELFQQKVGQYKLNEKERGHGFFYNPSELVWANNKINQVKYAIYGERFYIHEYVYREELGQESYKDLINQIDRTALMTEEERHKHLKECNRISIEILEELLQEEKNKQ